MVGRGRRVFSYGSHGNNWGHWGGWLHHQVGSPVWDRVWLRGHMWVMGRRHAHTIGHLGSDWSEEWPIPIPTPICCMEGRRAHCCCMSIPCILCIIGPTWIGFKKVILDVQKSNFRRSRSPAEGQHQLPWGSVAPPQYTHLKDNSIISKIVIVCLPMG